MRQPLRTLLKNLNAAQTVDMNNYYSESINESNSVGCIKFCRKHSTVLLLHTGSFHKYHDDGLQQAVFIKKVVNFLTQTA